MRCSLVLCFALALSGCATLTKEECLNGNWEEIGFRDGTNGRNSAFLQSHIKACEKTGVRPVQSLWEQGRLRGLPAYCVPSKAFSEGKKGNTLSAVCPVEQLPALQAANAKGLEYHAFSEEIAEARSEIDEIQRRVITQDNQAERTLLMLESTMLSQRIRMLEMRRASVGSL